MPGLFLFAQGGEAYVAMTLGSVCISLMLYFLPPFIAGMRRHQNTTAIFFVTLLLGWTGIGWMAALIWSFTPVERPRSRRRDDD